VSEIPAVAAAGFSAAADAYERGRPGYPDAAVAWVAERVGIGPGRTVLDLAAGTGKLTRSLVPLGARVVAVEPVDAMREKLLEVLPAVEALPGTAEAIPLPDASVDAVVVAQAFLWFDAQRALAEIHRVLRPGGGLASMWNSRDPASELNVGFEEIIRPHVGDTARHYDLDTDAELARAGGFAPTETASFPHEQRLDLEGFVDRIASMSFIAVLDPEPRAAVLDQARELARRAGDPVVVPYVTHVFATTALPIPRTGDLAAPSNEGRPA
jgi:SAM-dependent methyltransferase